MRLFHVPNSRSQRVLWLLEEVGEPYELTFLGNRASRVADQEHIARHPLGRVPVLEDGGQSIFESAAICLYLADKYPAAGLIAPTGTAERGLDYQWVVFGHSELEWRTVMIHTLDADSDAARDVKEALAAAVDVVEQALAGHEFLVADRFGVADIVISSVLSRIQRLSLMELPERVSSYLDAIDDRPAKQRAIAVNPAA
ncbi:MAG TPA: glutathione S-transferase family protein [Solirubrobacteraceae bacterium]|nr:glutathione S-transferase family protein [Solirubrobacteraceae bacterium]